MSLLLSSSLFLIPLLAADDTETKFFESITRDDLPAVRAFLKKNPGLARAKNVRGNSAVLVAANNMNSEEYFYPPKKNAVLQEILRLAPAQNAYEACIVGDLERARAFIDQEPGAVRSTERPWTLLHAAAYSGNVELVKLLLSRGAAVDAVATTKYRNTPLQTAMLTRQAAVARVLVEAGADVNHPQWEGFTVLHDAARQGDVELARFFLEHGAKADVKTIRGETPSAAAKTHGHPKLAAMLEQAAARQPKTAGRSSAQ